MKRRKHFLKGSFSDHSTGKLALRRYASLTPSERGLLKQLAELLRNCDIEGYQSITGATSRRRTEQIQHKLGVDSIGAAVEYAEQHNLLLRWRQTRLW